MAEDEGGLNYDNDTCPRSELSYSSDLEVAAVVAAMTVASEETETGGRRRSNALVGMYGMVEEFGFVNCGGPEIPLSTRT